MPVDDVLGWLRAYAVVGSARMSPPTRMAETASSCEIHQSKLDTDKVQKLVLEYVKNGSMCALKIIRKWAHAGRSRGGVMLYQILFRGPQ